MGKRYHVSAVMSIENIEISENSVDSDGREMKMSIQSFMNKLHGRLQEFPRFYFGKVRSCTDTPSGSYT